MGDNMNNTDLFKMVKELKLPEGKYALFGSAPLGIRGLKKCHDVDVVVKDDLWNEYKSRGWKVKVMPDGTPYLCEGKIELWKDWGPGQWNLNQLIEEAEIIDELPFVKLLTVLKWKKLNGREKDLKDIEAIENFLRIQK